MTHPPAPLRPVSDEHKHEPADYEMSDMTDNKTLVEALARAAYEAAHYAGPFGDEPINWGRGGFKTQVVQWEAVARAAIQALSTKPDSDALLREARGLLNAAHAERVRIEYSPGWHAEAANLLARIDANLSTPTAPTEAGALDGRQEIVASLIRDAIEIGTDEAADWNAKRVLAYLFPDAALKQPSNSARSRT